MRNAKVDDALAPRNFYVPEIRGGTIETASGAGCFFISGAKLYFNTGTAIEKITSA
jgi:hypothetical protein